MKIQLDLRAIEAKIEESHLVYYDTIEALRELNWDLSVLDDRYVDYELLASAWDDTKHAMSYMDSHYPPPIDGSVEYILFELFKKGAPLPQAKTDEIILLVAYYKNCFDNNTHIDFSHDSIHYNFYSLLLMRNDIVSHTANNLIFNDRDIPTTNELSLKSFVFFMALNGNVDRNLLSWYYIHYSHLIDPELAKYMISIVFEINDPRRSSLFCSIMNQLKYPKNIRALNTIKEYVEKTTIIYDNPNMNRPLNALLGDLRLSPKMIEIETPYPRINDYYKLCRIDPFDIGLSGVKEWFGNNGRSDSISDLILSHNTAQIISLTSPIPVFFRRDKYRFLYNLGQHETITVESLKDIKYHRGAVARHIYDLISNTGLTLDTKISFNENMERFKDLPTLLKDIYNKHYPYGGPKCTACISASEIAEHGNAKADIDTF